MKISIYVLLDPVTGEPRYVGLTRNLPRRISQYRYKAHSSRLDRWVKKLKREGMFPVPRLIETTDDPDRATHVERRWIRRLRRRFDLMNHTDGGEIGFHHSPESVKGCRQKNIEYWSRHPRVVSVATRKKLSEVHKRRVAEGLSNIGDLAKSRVGKPRPATVSEKLRALFKGKPAPLSPEGRQKLREAALRQWQDPEYRQKMHESGVRHTSKPEVMAYLGKRVRTPKVAESR